MQCQAGLVLYLTDRVLLVVRVLPVGTPACFFLPLLSMMSIESPVTQCCRQAVVHGRLYLDHSAQSGLMVPFGDPSSYNDK